MYLEIEQLIDLRVCITNNLLQLGNYKPATAEARVEQERKIASLKITLDKVEESIKDLTFEEERLAWGTIIDTVLLTDIVTLNRCDTCYWVGYGVDKKVNEVGTQGEKIHTCPICQGHNFTTFAKI